LEGLAVTRPAGKVSVNATPVSLVAEFGLVIVTVRDVVPFTGIDATPKTLAILGGPTTIRVAVAVLPVPPLVEETVVELTSVAAAVPVTVTPTVQDALAAKEPPDSESEPADATATPPHVLLRLEGLAVTRLDGKVSVNASPVWAFALSGLVIVMVMDVEPLTGIDTAPKFLVIEGAETANAGFDDPTATNPAAVPMSKRRVKLVTGARNAPLICLKK
jgi:hypothetical protein